MEGHVVCQLGSLANLAQSRLNRLSCLGGRVCGLKSMISRKVYLQLLMHAPCKGFIESNCNFIQNHLKMETTQFVPSKLTCSIYDV